MNSHEDKQKDFERKERELREREQAIRLREIETELYQQEPPIHHTVPHKPQPGKLKRWYKQMVKIGKFLAVVVVGIVAVQLGAWLAGVLIVGGLGWFSYKIFFDSDDSNK